jgi:hypothetical protein
MYTKRFRFRRLLVFSDDYERDPALDYHERRVAVTAGTLVLEIRPFSPCAAASRSPSLTML